MKEKILVTGAAGHLGFELVGQLLARNYPVLATVRQSGERSDALIRAGAEVRVLDLLDADAVRAAVAEVDVVMQVAAVFHLSARDPQRQVVEPNLRMAENVLLAAAACGTSKVVYTSSIAAMGTTTGSPLGEADWNVESPEPYARSKALSEQLAWRLAGQLGVPMASVLPGTIWGPGADRPTPSMQVLANVVVGKSPLALRAELSLVDVRDVAEAHILVLEAERATGRYLATNSTWSMSEIHSELLKLEPQLKTSARVAPDWLARVLPAMDWLRAWLTRSERTVNRALIREYLGKRQLFLPSRLTTELGWTPRSVRETVADSLQWTERYLGGKVLAPPPSA